MYGGSITAILIRTPGSPASACTLLDGYPMAQQGHAKKALKTALYSSVIADFISNIALIFFCRLLGKNRLEFWRTGILLAHLFFAHHHHFVGQRLDDQGIDGGAAGYSALAGRAG